MASNSFITIKCDFNLPTKIVSRILDDDVGVFVASTWAKYFAKYAPTQTGTMRESVTIKPYKVTYNQPYSHYQWEGRLYLAPNGSSWAKEGEIKHRTYIPLNYSKEQNPNVCSHWELPAFRAFSNSVARQVEQYIRRGGTV